MPGIALSEDGGRNWEMRGQGLPGAAVTAIALAAGTPDTLYAAARGSPPQIRLRRCQRR